MVPFGMRSKLEEEEKGELIISRIDNILVETN